MVYELIISGIIGRIIYGRIKEYIIRRNELNFEIISL